MANTPSSETKDKPDETPQPEVLKPQSEEATQSTFGHHFDQHPAGGSRPLRRGSYRPSHKATFIGLSVVAAILAINGGVLYFVMRGQNASGAQANRDEVTLTSATLDKLGVSRNSVGDLGTELIVGPNSRFNGKVTIGSDVSISGQLKLNSKFTASDASLAKLEAGDVALNQLNVNGDGTVSNLNLRKDLSVTGLTRLQGPVTVSQLLTVNNNLNVAGNLAVGGLLSARSFQASSLVSDTTLMVGGHIITRGAATSVGRGGALAGTDTVSISGNDTAGTVAVNFGPGTKSGIIANVAFRSNFSTIPHVVVTSVGGPLTVYVTRSAGGFSIGIGSTNIGIGGASYAFDYIVMQ